MASLYSCNLWYNCLEIIIGGGAWWGFSRRNFFSGNPPNVFFFLDAPWTIFFLATLRTIFFSVLHHAPHQMINGWPLSHLSSSLCQCQRSGSGFVVYLSHLASPGTFSMVPFLFAKHSQWYCKWHSVDSVIRLQTCRESSAINSEVVTILL